MALSIKDDETDALVRQLAKARNLSFTAAIHLAVSNELQRQPGKSGSVTDRMALLERIQHRIDGLPVLDDRPLDDLLDYDAGGLPG
jgi:antitoxin VapB